MENVILYPIPTLKKTEPILKDYYGFECSMLNNNLLNVYDIYANNFGQYSKKEEETYLLEPPKHKSKKEIQQNLLSSEAINLDEQYKCTLNVGKNILLNLGYYTAEAIAEIYFKYMDDNECTENDINIFYSLIMMAAVYYKHSRTKGLFDFEEPLVNDMQMDYSYKVRPDLLKLYEMFHAESKVKSKSIRIEYKNEVISLDNFDNWFTNMITPYLDKYLGVQNIQEAQAELEKDYPEKKQKGRKKTNNIADIMLMGTYKLIQSSSFAEEGKSLTNKQAEFLLEYLKYLGLIEPDSSKDDTLNLRATVNNLKKYTLHFNWWAIPMRKESPNNPFDGSIEKAW